MSAPFMFNSLEMKILGNFKEINTEMVIEPDKVTVMNIGKSIMANYKFDNPYSFKKFGVYEISDILNIIKSFDNNVVINVYDKFIDLVGTKNDKVRYFTAADELIEPVPDIESKLKSTMCHLKAYISQDKIAYIKAMAGCLKSQFIFIETVDKKIRITVGNDINSSIHNYELYLDDNIDINNLKSIVKIPITDFKLIEGDYELSIHSKDEKTNKIITKWVNLNGCVYYIFCGVI